MKLIRILSDRIQMKTDEFEFADARINDLIAVTDGKVTLVTSITSLTDTDTSPGLGEEDFISQLESIKVIECSIIGSVKDGKYHNAIDEYPTTDIKAAKITSKQFAAMIGDKKSGFQIGKYCAYDCPAVVDGNRFFQRHACIVGNTGSGKSETVARILEETAKLPGANIIVFDIHGEYGRISYVDNIKFGEDIDFPIWMFGLRDMAANILKIKEDSSTVAMSALRKSYHTICPDGNEGKPVWFDYKALLVEMCKLNTQEVNTGDVYKSGDKAGMYKTVKGELNGKLTGIVNAMQAKICDRRYSFLFAPYGQEYLYQLMQEIMGGDKPVKNIDLSGLPHDVAISVIGALTKTIYEIQRTGTTYNPITLVCDEAHVYIPDNFQLSASERRMVEIFEDIAKEGRKFGITLFVASQRPSELNRTIMAQCANFIVGKLNNENDKNMIKGMLPDGNESVIDSTTMFSPGDVLIVGDASPIPLKIHVQLANERPQSRTIDFWNEWKKKSLRIIQSRLRSTWKSNEVPALCLNDISQYTQRP